MKSDGVPIAVLPRFEILAGNLQGTLDTGVAIAASRWGATGLLTLDGAPTDRARAAVDRLVTFGRGALGIKLDASPALRTLAAALPDAINLVVLSTTASEEWPVLIETVRRTGRRVLCECTSEDQGRLAVAAGADAVVAKGSEAGGHVGEETTFVLVQRLMSCGLPVWAAGGISLHTAAACRIAGCAGIVVDAALALTRESTLPPALRAVIERTEGDDTACVGATVGDHFRLHRKSGSRVVEELLDREQQLAGIPSQQALARWREELRARVHAAEGAALWPLGQDASFASSLARRYRTVAGVLDAFRTSIETHVTSARRLRHLAPGAPLARAHGTTYPILQGPMTRVSDTPEFADSVSTAGALPFLALALMRGPQILQLLEQTQARLGDRPWGVGILGFVPPELREEQLEAVRTVKPKFALIAGGRPDQAVTLERDGIATYLHVPSPGLLRAFIEGGARRFVFEGRECGGHVGPRTSFVLWTAMIDVLLDMVRSGVPGEELHVVFAGGVHDGLSAAMVAALSAPLAAADVRVGVLVGTAYLFTEEAVASRAIGQVFQREALDCSRTVLFETAPGHSIRCADTPYFQTFRELKRKLASEGKSPDELKDRLELLNLGRLRLASKGLLREDLEGTAHYFEAPPEQQRLDGMYMLGQVAVLRRDVLSIRDLHHQISVAGTAVLDAVVPGEPAGSDEQEASDIAIVGVGCLLPGAPDARAFWSNILNRVDAIKEVPSERFDADRFFDPDVKARDRIVSRWGGFLDDVPFDPLRYGIPPAALSSIDALQLLALEVVNQALKDAGLDDRPFPRERTSVIMGASGGLGDLGLRYGVRAMLPALMDDVPEQVLQQLPEWTEDSFPGILLNVAAGRIANRFDFGGVNFTVDAACASSLAAVQLGIAELERGTSDVVVVGGIDTVQSPFGYMCFSKAQALSPRGKCRTFDQDADGIAISEGLVALVIKRLSDAERDGNRIYAVVKAVAGSSDGRGKGLTAPRPEGQVRALRRAYARAGFSPATVGLIEAHGTGTVAGDGAEVMALDEVFRAAGAAPDSCAIGSVKSMIGHTKASAGVAGLLKAALALHHRVLPPTLNVEMPNGRLRDHGSPFFVNVEPTPWAADATPRRAGVSSFGFGGTNFHAVLEEYTGSFLDDPEPGCDRWPAEMFVWSAPDAPALAETLAPLRRALEDSPPSLRSLAASCSAPAATSGLRLAIVATSVDALRVNLAAADEALAAGKETFTDPRGVYIGKGAPAGRIAFVFPGQGSQSPGMLRELAVHFAEVRDTLRTFDRTLDGRLPGRLSGYIYPPPSFTEEDRQARARALTDTRIAQPALGAVEAGLLNLLAGCGVRPDMVAGHSYGEYVALHAAGVIDTPTLAALSEQRGRAIADTVDDQPGAMAAAAADPAAVRSAIGDAQGVWLVNFNAPKQTIIAGGSAALDDALSALARHGISARPLPVACAFHTPLMHGARVKLDEALAAVPLAMPRMPVYSNTLADAYPNDPQQIKRTLSDHLEHPVLFVDEIRAMYDAGARIFVEVGPRAVLTGLIRQIAPDAVVVALNHGEGHELLQFLQGLGQLAAHGVPVSRTRLFEGRAAETLDKDLRPVVRGSAATWVVNGTGARLAAAPVAPRPRVPIDARLETPPTRVQVESPTNATNAAREMQLVPMPTRSPVTNDIPPFASGDSTLAGADAVMQQFQQVMSQFLNTQAAIMAAYLGGADPHQLLPQPAAVPVSSTIDQLSPASAALAQAVPPASVLSAASGRLAPPPPVSAPPVQAVTPSTAAAVDFAALLVQVAAERTGYSPEMLGLDLNLEADLGIDSIKRVEILSSVRRQCAEADQQRLQSAMDALTRVKTLREMAATMTSAAGGPALAETRSPAPTPPASVPEPQVDLTQELLLVVSERTGYPIEMLGADLNLEADLGIDSIKRVEILTTFRQRRTAAEQSALQAVMDQLTRLKTLAELSRTIQQALGRASAPVAEDSVPRTVFSIVDAPPAVPVPSSQRATGVILVTDDGAGVAAEVCARLRGSGDRPFLLKQRDGAAVDLNDGVCSADWTDAAAAARGLTRVRESGPIAALVHVAPLAAAPPLDRMSLAEWRRRIDTDLRQLHILTKAAAPDLRAWGPGSGAAILAITALGGDFGEAGRLDRPTHGGVVGYLRTAAIEFPDVRVRIVDFEPGEAIARTAQRVVAELDADGPLEIGYQGSRRITLVAHPAPRLPGKKGVAIGSDSVVLLTGGARGITSEIATELARRFHPTLVLAGLSGLPTDPEPPLTASLEGAALKAAITSDLKKGQKAPRPVDVEAVFQRIVRHREIRATRQACEAAGSRVEYRQVDVRDEAAVKGLLDHVYARFGRLDVVVHGAGVIEDKLIEDKSVESFDRVVHTKTDSVFTLMQGLRHETLGALVLMSSVTAAFGNRGQADYGAANGVYNAMAQLLAPRSAGRVVAMNWGPWDKVGMASEGVKRQLIARGIIPISPAPGVRAMLDELAGGSSAEAVVVLGAGPWADASRTERQVETLA